MESQRLEIKIDAMKVSAQWDTCQGHSDERGSGFEKLFGDRLPV